MLRNLFSDSFKGGLRFERNRSRLRDLPIVPLQPDSVCVPLNFVHEPAPRWIIEDGAVVRRGDAVAIMADGSARHATISGRVVGSETVQADQKVHVAALEIAYTTDEAPPSPNSPAAEDLAVQRRPLNGARHDGDSISLLIEQVRRAGLWRCHPAEEPVAAALQGARRRRIHTLIVWCFETEPLLSADARAFMEAPARVGAAAADLADALDARRGYLAVSSKPGLLMRAARRACAGLRVKPVALSAKYPQEWPALLVRSICRKTLPAGQPPSAIGVLAVNVQTLLSMADARQGRPMLERAITVAGDAVERPGCYRVPVGAPVREVLRRTGGDPARTRELIIGGPLSGVRGDPLRSVVGQSDRAILAFTRSWNPDRSPSACSRCGQCLDVCPVALDPMSLLKLAELGAYRAAEGLSPSACLDCRLCDYVCPSLLPLSHGVAALKANNAGETAGR